jgi:hypothetical protein
MKQREFFAVLALLLKLRKRAADRRDYRAWSIFYTAFNNVVAGYAEFKHDPEHATPRD